MNTVGFHEGELRVQRRAGVERDAARLEGMLKPADLRGGAAAFLAARDLAVITGRSTGGRLWTSLLSGSPGFLEGRENVLSVHAAPGPDDPLHGLPTGQDVGLLAIDFAIRRRVRVNGRLTAAGSDGLEIEADQAFGNCPSYIQRRDISRTSDRAAGEAEAGTVRERPGAFTAEQARVIAAADTFFLGTTHPTRGADTSHKGGSPGFVRIEDGGLWWPDYAGNNMFNSMGNIAVDPTVALLFVDFATGTAVRLSGTAELQWLAPGSPGDDGGTGRRVRFRTEEAVTTTLPVRDGGQVAYSPHNPALAPE